MIYYGLLFNTVLVLEGKVVKGIDQKSPGVWWYTLSGRPEAAEQALAAVYPRHGKKFLSGDVELTVITGRGDTVVQLMIDTDLPTAEEQMSAVRENVRSMFSG